MNRIASTLAYTAVILATTQLHAATVKLDAFAYDTRNAADFGPPAVPLVTDADGNVLNPTVGQVYAILITLSVSNLDTLPGGAEEEGLASLRFDIDLHGLHENDLFPGWNLDQQNLDLNGSPPGGCCVPLWLDLDGTLNDIAVGVDVADFERSEQPPNNPIFDSRRIVGQGLPWNLGRIYVDYQAGETQLDIAIDSFEVHDLESVYPGTGLAIGDTLLFVPEPPSLITGLIVAIVAITGKLRIVRQYWNRKVGARRRRDLLQHLGCVIVSCLSQIWSFPWRALA